MSTKIFLIRHGETKTNKEGLMHFDEDKAELTSCGIRQMEKTAEALEKYKIFKIFSSTGCRAVQSAEIIAKHFKLKSEEVEGLEERKWGIYEGKPWEEIQKILDKMTLEERYTFVPEGGESWNRCLERLEKTVEKIIKENEGKNIAIITHGGAIRVLIPQLLKEPKESSFNYDPPNASISAFEYSDDKFNKLILLDASHLA